MNKNYIIRQYKEGDEVSIMKLRGMVFADSKSIDWWIWQQKLNPGGQAIITVAEDEDSKEIIGHACLLPLRIKVGDEMSYTVTPVDAMVHPDYRGLGILGQLRRKDIEICIQKDYAFSYAFPNLITSAINRRYGVKLIFKKTPLWIKPLQVRNIVARYYQRSGMFASLITMVGKGITRITDRSRSYQILTQVREVKEIDERFDTLWQQASSHHEIMLVRDRAYLDWRYIKKPDADYTIYVSEHGDHLLGYIVLRIVEDNDLRIGWIVDILTYTKATPASMDLATKAVQHFRAMGVDIVQCIMPPKAYLVPSLRRHGFIRAFRQKRHTFFISSTVMIQKYSELFLINPNNWYVNRGDSDSI